MTIDPELGPMKRCTRCGEDRPADTEFFPRSGTANRELHSWCKACWASYQRDRRALHRELVG